MPKKLYVGNLPRSLSAAQLESLFAAYGEVKSVEVIIDRATGQSRGFAFVQMQTQQQTRDAIDALDGSEVEGSRVTVSEARDRPQGSKRARPSSRPGGGGKRRRSGEYGRRR